MPAELGDAPCRPGHLLADVLGVPPDHGRRLDGRELDQGLEAALAKRVFIYNGRIDADEDLLRDCRPELSRRIVILGERDESDNDGGNLHLQRLVRKRIEQAAVPGARPVKIHLHIGNPVLYAQALTVPREGFAENDDRIDLEPFNYFESWAWRCWSAKGADDGGPGRKGDAYLPLRHRPDAERVELFILGAGPMGRAMARFAMPLMTYGSEGRRWLGVPRWARWSSVNCADAIRERAAAFPGFATDVSVRGRMLRAEHSRWWTERLLAGWVPCEKPADKADKEAKKAAFQHWDLVPFDRLDDFTKDLDKVSIAAMAALGC